MSGLTSEERERRKFGTETPHQPTDEFVVQAFAEGARALWPDSRDPGWHVTFNRWLAARLADAEARAEAAEAKVARVEALATRPIIAVHCWEDGERVQKFYADIREALRVDQ